MIDDANTQRHVTEKRSTTPTLEDGVVEHVREPSLLSRLDHDELDRTLTSQASQQFSETSLGLNDSTISAAEKSFKREDYIYVEFEEGDQRNPVNFSKRKKWTITAMACCGTFLSSAVVAVYNLGFDSMIRDLRCTEFQATLGLSVFTLGFGVVPLVTSSFSEEFGRLPLYILSGIGFFLMFPMIALSRNIETVIVARFFQGAFGSTAATMVGGTIADIWLTKERGVPMALFTMIAIGATGLAPVYAGWIAINPNLEWRWLQWVHMMATGVYLLLLPFFMKETRSSIVLIRIAKKLRKTTGDNRYRARVEDDMPSLMNLIIIACTRPIRLMCTELVVASFSIWLGFAWGVMYCMLESIPGIFQQLHNFNIAEIGSVYVCLVFGSILGFCINFYQEKLYHRYFSSRGPEARLYLACFAAILMPIAMFIYAWSSLPFVPWVALTIGITLYIWATFIIYLAAFNYIADCYGPFASSAIAGQSLARNLSAASFPLFTNQMYSALTYKWANTLFGCFAVLLVPIPFVLFFYGPAIRKRSKFSRAVMGL